MFSMEWLIPDAIARLIREAPPNFTGLIDKPKFKLYLINGKVGREGDLPAAISLNRNNRPSAVRYYKEGVLHRENGPANINVDGSFWFLNGVEFTREKHEAIMRIKRAYKQHKERKAKAAIRYRTFMTFKNRVGNDIAGLICSFV